MYTYTPMTSTHTATRDVQTLFIVRGLFYHNPRFP